MKTQPPSPRAFIALLYDRWSESVSGKFSVAFGALAIIGAPVLRLSKVPPEWVVGYFGLMGGCALVTACYGLWVRERGRVILLEECLDPKLTLHFDPSERACFTETQLADTLHQGVIRAAGERVFYIRVLPVCQAPSLDACVGAITGVFVLQPDGVWAKTAYDEKLDLSWSNRNSAAPITLHSDVPQYLDVMMVRAIPRSMQLCTPNFFLPNRARAVLNAAQTFRIDVVVVGANNARANISIKVQAGRNGGPPPVVELV